MNVNQMEELIGKMTLDEKIGMIHGNQLFQTKGVERLGIPPFISSDGPMGCRLDYQPASWQVIGQNYDYTSYLPSNTALAATWNPDIAYETGKILGKEARGRGKDMILAPGINMMRTPLCGRSFEYMGEDPHLAAEMVVPMIQGIQENDVAACVKHFAVNSQETNRTSINAKVDERTLQEIYFPAFKAAVKKGKAASVMGAYNKLNGSYCCHNDYLLNEVLRKDWEFDGFVISDWGGVKDTMEAAFNGLDMEMSVTDNFDEYYMAGPLKKMVEEGKVPESIIDDKVRNILRVMNRLHMLDGERKTGTYNDAEDRRSLRKAAEESIVLLKNKQNILPLDEKKIKHILIVGDNGDRMHALGGGSAEIKALYEISPLLGMSMLLGGNVTIQYEPGYYASVVGNVWDEGWQANSLEEDSVSGNREDGKGTEWTEKNREYRQRALKAAKDADVVIYIGGLNHDYDVEGMDRRNLKLPYGQDKLILDLLSVRQDLIVVMMTGSPVDMSVWLDKTDTLVQTWYNGMEGGYALAEILFGKVNPSGKLPETFPMALIDTPACQSGISPEDKELNYTEGVFIGYRHYDINHIKPAFSFGYGLSYTDFSITDGNVELKQSEDGLKVQVSVTVTNEGKLPGAQVVQIYTGCGENSLNPAVRPIKELKGFQKISLNPGESGKVTIILDGSAFSSYSTSEKCFIVEPGKYNIYIATSCTDIIETHKIYISNRIKYSK
ncbi:beta-glucosidase family protein [Anaerocolumna sp. MB42-C2]|uniref:beta-glucosidase family protein n=1 Tax=Anaerocolumna sp. MB42-C2 TaxID=3070997 RepID=UPI0027DFE6B5|nr:glycoside hydrolase family 3 C-terminal domain-containing protein [Anaerocolumna sp. MB42-C2]WMJ86690.1 glycoside hydrolase family 3 C-terminal domain-containing protein [Anaerocolumna sp. MB42-C2]